jgi:hypothetical protein
MLKHQIESLTKLGTLTIKYDDENHLFGAGVDAGTWVSGTNLEEVVSCLVSKTPLLGKSGNLEPQAMEKVAENPVNDEVMAAALAMESLVEFNRSSWFQFTPEQTTEIHELIQALGLTILESLELKNSSNE